MSLAGRLLPSFAPDQFKCAYHFLFLVGLCNLFSHSIPTLSERYSYTAIYRSVRSKKCILSFICCLSRKSFVRDSLYHDSIAFSIKFRFFHPIRRDITKVLRIGFMFINDFFSLYCSPRNKPFKYCRGEWMHSLVYRRDRLIKTIAKISRKVYNNWYERL